MIEELKGLIVAKYQVEDLIRLRAGARSIFEEYSTQKLEAPEWLNNAVNDLDREIASRVRDERAHRLAQAKAKRSALRTVDEKRGELDREIQELEETLK